MSSSLPQKHSLSCLGSSFPFIFLLKEVNKLAITTKVLHSIFENLPLPLFPATALFFSAPEPFSETFITELCCTWRSDHLKPSVLRYVGSWRNVISIISQRRTELNYQHGCVQTRAKLITLGWSPCCLCPRSARSQLTTWRFIAGTAQLPTSQELSSSTPRFFTLSTLRGQTNGEKWMHMFSLVDHLVLCVIPSLIFLLLSQGHSLLFGFSFTHIHIPDRLPNWKLLGRKCVLTVWERTEIIHPHLH